VGLRLGFDVGLSHKIEAGADIFLMPSRYEPCGLNQMYSLGTGRSAGPGHGGLDDTIQPSNPPTGPETDSSSPSDRGALLATARRALELYRKPDQWRG